MFVKKLYKTIAAALLLLPATVWAQSSYTRVKIEWQQPAALVMGEDSSINAPSFRGAQYPLLPEDILPGFIQNIPLDPGLTATSVSIRNLVYVPLAENELALVEGNYWPDTVAWDLKMLAAGGKPIARFELMPFGRDSLTGAKVKLVSFDYQLQLADKINTRNVRAYVSNSELSMGNWYKFHINESGIYRITYDDLKNMGVNMTQINPDMIRIFGNGGKLLSETAGNNLNDDIVENAIQVVTAVPGVFKQGDYILFYGQGTLTWSYSPLTGRMEHLTHYYADKAAYFLSIGPLPGLRVSTDNSTYGNPNYFTDAYTDMAVYEKDQFNLIQSGRTWYSDKLDYYTRSHRLPSFTFKNLIEGENATLRFSLVGRSPNSRIDFSILANGEEIGNTYVQKTGKYDYAMDVTRTVSFQPSYPNIDLQWNFTPSSTNDFAWLDYMSLNVRSALVFDHGQLAFRDPGSIGQGRITRFTMKNVPRQTFVWDVTNPLRPINIPLQREGDEIKFVRSTTGLVEMIAFDGTDFLSIEKGTKIRNQNLHATGNYDMIIVTVPEFKTEADRLATTHNNIGEISAAVVLLPEIYNEFSSGIQDITAIRDFMKMLYDRGKDQGYPRYLLLFGNASYDVKNRPGGGGNFVPTYESPNSLRTTVSYLSDDYYGLLDDGEGSNTAGLLDIGIGRLPVRNLEQAKVLTDKLIYYLTNTPETHGDWRNTIIIPADDEDRNTHLRQAESLADSISVRYPEFNVDKIYFDAYRQVSTPGGNRFPDVNREIASRVEKGAILVNYIGHGGIVGWGHERVLEISDILGWNNYDRMGLFFTATCEFSRFDDPSLISAGELVMLNPNGGAVSMVTTTRLAYASHNENLNMSFIDTVFNDASNGVPRLGDVMKHTKNQNSNVPNTRHLTLFGDPSMAMPVPRNKVITTSITNAVTGEAVDTIRANSMITVTGELRSASGTFMPDFNGTVYVKLFDKISKVKTLGQDPESFVKEFEVWKNIIYQGSVSVNGGKFSLTFPIPLDIEYKVGKGRLSYYATNGIDDARGYFEDFRIGGAVSELANDFTGPAIKMFMNDSTFQDGDLTSEFPRLTALLYDESGINTIGNSIGHDILATLDGDSYNAVALNDFYVADLNSYKSGKVKYQYFNLSEGPHTLTLRAWDIFNNSNEATINFVVKKNIILNVDKLIAYPNPSRGEVWFKLNHNLFDGTLEVEMSIYSTTGELVRLMEPVKVVSDGYTSSEIYWDGRLYDGSQARAGLYLCRVKVRDRNGNISSETAKVIIAR